MTGDTGRDEDGNTAKKEGNGKRGRERKRERATATARHTRYSCFAHGTNALYRLNVLALTVSPLDIYAAADVDVTCTVIHGHLVRLTHRGRHHKTLSGCPLPPQRDDRTRPINRLAQLEASELTSERAR